MAKHHVFSLKLLITAPGLLLAFACMGDTGLSSIHAAELLVADRAMNRILAFDATTGAFSRVLVTLGDEDMPAALAIDDSSGYLYVANQPLGEVLKVDLASGTYSTYLSGINGPGGLAYDETTGDLWVSEFGNFDGELIKQYDNTGTLVRTIGTGTGATGRAGLAFDTAGNLYASSFGNDGYYSGSVLKFDHSNDFASLGTFASGSGLAGASGLAFDGAGNLLVAGMFSNNVVKYLPSGGVSFTDGLVFPSGVLLAADGNLLVTSMGTKPEDLPYIPGYVTQYDIATGEMIGVEPFIRALGVLLQGDYDVDEFGNGNELVDGLDLAAWRDAFGDDDSADSDDDDDSDGADFLAWQLNLGNLGEFQPTSLVRYEGTSVNASPVPEPSAAWMALLGMGSLCAGRTRIEQSNHR